MDQRPSFPSFNVAFFTHGLDEEEGGISHLEQEKCLCNILLCWPEWKFSSYSLTWMDHSVEIFLKAGIYQIMLL